MKAIARRQGDTFTHRIEIRRHELIADEPRDREGDDAGPTPQELLAASLASCTAITIEMYARRKDWDLGSVEVECEYEQPERGRPAEIRLLLRLPRTCSPEQEERIRTIAAKCPVHRLLEGPVRVEDRVELTQI